MKTETEEATGFNMSVEDLENIKIRECKDDTYRTIICKIEVLALKCTLNITENTEKINGIDYPVFDIKAPEEYPGCGSPEDTTMSLHELVQMPYYFKESGELLNMRTYLLNNNSEVPRTITLCQGLELGFKFFTE